MTDVGFIISLSEIPISFNLHVIWFSIQISFFEMYFGGKDMGLGT